MTSHHIYIANHTKKSSWKVFQANYHLLTSMGVGSTLTDDTERAAETFICRIYNISTTDSVDTARHTLFYNVKKETLFTFTFTRVHHQALIVIWRNAHLGQPEIPAPETMGWKQSEAGLQPILMSLCPIPDACLEVISCSCKTQCHTRRCKCRRNGLQCTALCYCRSTNDNQHRCMNIVL